MFQYLGCRNPYSTPTRASSRCCLCSWRLRKGMSRYYREMQIFAVGCEALFER